MKLKQILMLALLLGLIAKVHLEAQVKQTTANVKLLGSTTLTGQPSAGTEIGAEVQTGPVVDRVFNRNPSGNISPARVPADHVPTPAGNAVVSADAGFFGFSGISHRDQRLASNGNQFSLEPPDQGLAVGNGFVVETVNDAIRVFTTAGQPFAATESLNAFFQLAPNIVRTKPPVFGPFISDPKLYFDSATARFFLSVLEIDVDPSTGNFLPHTSVLLAVSTSHDPTGVWNIFKIDTTDNTGTPDHANCPCLGDQPLIGADANGFYISTNEFPLFVNGFNGAQVYAMSKAALVSGKLPTVVHFSGLPLAEGIAFSIQPATVPPGGNFETGSGGTEYFLSSLDFNNTLDNRIAVWALTNTSSLNSRNPALTLSSLVLDSEVYGFAPSSQQRPGPTPLADSLNEHLELVDSNDDRMNQVVFADGKLWSAVDTVVKTANGPTRAAVAYFIVVPSVAGNTLSATIATQGYLAVNNNNVDYPSIGVNAAGKGILAVTLVGPDFFPSSAYAPIDANGVGDLRVGAAGTGPDDGFTGYSAFGGARVGRWGDYTAAAADADGSIWFATEFIPNSPRTLLANWGTFVGNIKP